MPSSVGSHHQLPYLSVRFVSLCLWLPDSLISLFLKKTLDQLPLKEHTLPFHIPYTNHSVVLHFMLLWKQQEYGTGLRYHCRGKNHVFMTLCIYDSIWNIPNPVMISGNEDLLPTFISTQVQNTFSTQWRFSKHFHSACDLFDSTANQ